MKLFFNLILFIIFFAYEALADDYKKEVQFTIFSGDKKATFYKVTSGICNVFNRHYLVEGLRCVAKESAGSETNLHLLSSSEADLAVVKSPEFNNFFVKNSQQLQKKINFVANIHDEYLTVLVQKKLAVKSISDLSDKIVNIGLTGSTSELVIKKYFSDYKIKPKEIVNFGADISLKMMCDKKIDAWIYFIGHPNSGYEEVLKKCDVELIALSENEIANLLKIAAFFQKNTLPKTSYTSLKSDLPTVSSKTILASRKNLDSKIVSLVKKVLVDHKEELVKEGEIFRSF